MSVRAALIALVGVFAVFLAAALVVVINTAGLGWQVVVALGAVVLFLTFYVIAKDN